MKAEEYEAVVYEGEVYCNECLPSGVDINDPEVHPIFAIDEVNNEQVCCECGQIHDYMSILNTTDSLVDNIEHEHNDAFDDLQYMREVQEQKDMENI